MQILEETTPTAAMSDGQNILIDDRSHGGHAAARGRLGGMGRGRSVRPAPISATRRAEG